MSKVKTLPVTFVDEGDVAAAGLSGARRTWADDMATLTGTARVALGPDLPPLYSTDDELARALMAAGAATDGPAVANAAWSC